MNVLVGKSFETLGSKDLGMKTKVCFRPHHLDSIKKKKDIINYETSNFHHHGLKNLTRQPCKAAEVLDNFGVAYEKESCFRTPHQVSCSTRTQPAVASKVSSRIAGGAAHLPGMVAAKRRPFSYRGTVKSACLV